MVIKIENIKEIKEVYGEENFNKAVRAGYVPYKCLQSKVPLNEHGDYMTKPLYIMAKMRKEAK